MNILPLLDNITGQQTDVEKASIFILLEPFLFRLLVCSSPGKYHLSDALAGVTELAYS